MKTRKQKIMLSAGVLIFIIGVLLVVFYSYRQELLQKAITKVTQKLQIEYSAELHLQNAHFDGFTAIAVENVSLVPKNGDTLFKIQKCRTSVSFWRLFVGKIQLGSLEAKNGFVQFIKTENGSNFAEFINKKKPRIALFRQF